MGGGNFHPEAVAQLLSGQLHAVQHYPGGGIAHGMQMQIQSCRVELQKKILKFLFVQSGNPGLGDVRIGIHQRAGMELQCAVNENLQRMNLHMFRVEFVPHTLKLPQTFLHFSRG